MTPDPWAPESASPEERVAAFDAVIRRREAEQARLDAVVRRETPEEIILRELVELRERLDAVKVSLV
jgi:hypothetical protein